MDKEMKDKWAASMDKLLHLPKTKRDHFALLLVSLADCYANDEADENAKAVVLISRDDTLALFSAGAAEADCMDLLIRATELLTACATADAPPKEMFN
jgi:hypothetical protein